ncbi:MAG: malate dehydrogenase (quinone) [Nodosilinea sp.]
METQRCDVLVVGGGIMGATLASLLWQLDRTLTVVVVEQLSQLAAESSAAMNNAGTGHAANCELNYTPAAPDGSIPTAKALAINTAFEHSLEFWSSLVEQQLLGYPADFIRPVPHLSFVWGETPVAFLQRRYQALSALPPFADMVWSTDWGQLQDWMPLVMQGRRPDQPLAATRVGRATDIDFGRLSQRLLEGLERQGMAVLRRHQVVKLRRQPAQEGHAWQVQVQKPGGDRGLFEAAVVFLGAGGGTLPLLQRSRIPEARLYGAFPVSGQWLVCRNPRVIAAHHAKVYGMAQVGAPPMSVPHLDTRWIQGQRALLFGPYAGFTTRFLKQGSLWDLPRSIRPGNLLPCLQAGLENLDLVRYLLGQVVQSMDQRLASLREFLPEADGADWELAIAGQRVQLIKQIQGHGRLLMGTEVVSSRDGSLTALLGASPGASTAVPIMVEVVQRSLPQRWASPAWQQRLRQVLPSWGVDLAQDPRVLARVRQRNNEILGL